MDNQQDNGQTQSEPQLATVVALSGPKQLLKTTFAFYKQHIKAVLLVSVISFVAVLLNVVGILLSTGPAAFMILVCGIASVVFSLIGYIALVLLVSEGGQIQGGLKALLSRSTTYIWPLLLTSVLSALAYFGGFILLIIPGIFIAIALSLSMFIVVLEQKRGINALTTSWHYVKGYWWAIVGRLFVAFFTLIAVSIVSGIILTMIGLDVSSTSNGPMTTSELIGFIINQALSAFVFIPFITIYNYLIYKELRAIKTVPATAEEDKKRRSVIMIFSVVALLGVIALIVFAGFIMGYLAQELGGMPLDLETLKNAPYEFEI